MLIRSRLILFSSLVITVAIVAVTYIIFQEFDRFVTEARVNEMFHELSAREEEIIAMHSNAREYILFAVANPIFKEYFSLPESRENLYDDSHMLQFMKLV